MPERAAAVFQEPRLCEDFSLISNVKIAAKKDVAPAEIAAGLEALGLSEFAGKKVRVLSGGPKQRAAILRAVLSGCGVVLMDEPFKGLDEGTKEKTDGFCQKGRRRKNLPYYYPRQERGGVFLRQNCKYVIILAIYVCVPRGCI